jgi:hypothetical protein
VACHDLRLRPGRTGSYVFFEKAKFVPGTKLWVVLVVCDADQDTVYLIPSKVWLTPDDRFVSRDYGEGRKSKPEWRLNWSERKRAKFEEFLVAAVAVGGRSK